MSVIDEYTAGLPEPEKAVVEHMNQIVRQMVPAVTEETYYGMPAFKYKGKGLVSMLVNKRFLSLYPFGNLDRLGLDISGYETTKGSVHFSAEKPVTDEFLKQIITARIHQIDR